MRSKILNYRAKSHFLRWEQNTGLGLLSANLQGLPELLTLFPDLSPDVNEAPCPKFSVKGSVRWNNENQPCYGSHSVYVWHTWRTTVHRHPTSASWLHWPSFVYELIDDFRLCFLLDRIFARSHCQWRELIAVFSLPFLASAGRNSG